MNKCHELPQTKVSYNKDSGRTGLLLIKRFVIQFSGSEEVTGFFKEMKLEKSLKSIYIFF